MLGVGMFLITSVFGFFWPRMVSVSVMVMDMICALQGDQQKISYFPPHYLSVSLYFKVHYEAAQHKLVILLSIPWPSIQ
jgi:hypothetical protein